MKRRYFIVGVAVLLAVLTAAAANVGAQQPTRTYVWFGQVVSYDATGQTVTVRVPYQEHINRYIAQFMRGDKLTLFWDTPRPGETDTVRYVEKYDAKSVAHHGYVLPVEFVWIKVTAPFEQPKETASILSVAASTEAEARPKPPASPPASQ